MDARLPDSSGWLVPLAVLGVAVAEAATGSVALVGPVWLFLVFATLACAALMWRKRRPLTVLTVMSCLVLLQALLGTHAQSVALVLVLVLSVFACGRYAGRPQAFLAVPLGVATTLAASALSPLETIESSWGWSLNVVWIFALGSWFRTQRRLVEATRAEAEERVRAGVAEERVRIAQELHDVLAHSLSVMVVQAETAAELFDSAPEQSKLAVDRVQATGREALAQTRWLLKAIREPTPEPTITRPSLAEVPQLVSRLEQAGLPVSFENELGDVTVPEQIGRAVYRLVQESLTNVLRHAGHQPTLVHVSGDADRVVLQVRNRGGMSAVPEHNAGHGLLGMKERVESCGGSFWAGAEPTGGFLVRADLPLAGEERA